MKRAFPLTAFVAILIGAITVACAQDSQLERIRDKVTKMIPDIARKDIRPTKVEGLYEVQQGSLFGYVTADGKYLIEGDLIDLDSGVSITENKRKADRLAKIDDLGKDKMIVFGPKQPADDKYHVTVFTDVDCGYCRKFHREIDQYNALGIEVRYVFYPRSGPHSESFRKAEQVWCSKDRHDAFTKAIDGNPVKGDWSCKNPVQSEWDLGNALGLRGTPMLVLSNGEVVNGYLPPKALAERLKAVSEKG